MKKSLREGELFWEYYLEGFYVDAVWFSGAPGTKNEEPGKITARRFPAKDQTIVLCETKSQLTSELVGQAMVYSKLARRAWASLISTIVFAKLGLSQTEEVREDWDCRLSYRLCAVA